MDRSLWGTRGRTEPQRRRVRRLLDGLGVPESLLRPRCGAARVHVQLFVSPAEDVTLRRMERFYGLSRGQLARAALAPLLERHHERMSEAEELGYGRG
jgi:hypothetical protein